MTEFNPGPKHVSRTRCWKAYRALTIAGIAGMISWCWLRGIHIGADDSSNVLIPARTDTTALEARDAALPASSARAAVGTHRRAGIEAEGIGDSQISVRVHMSSGMPAHGRVLVTMRWEDWMHGDIRVSHCYAGDDGRASFEIVPPGCAYLSTDHGGRAEVPIEQQGATSIDIRLPELFVVTGRVMNPRGDIVPDARIILSDSDKPSAAKLAEHTDANGRFVLNDVPFASRIAAYSPEHGATQAIEVTHSCEIELTCTFPAPGVLVVAVTDRNAVPLSDCTVSIVPAMQEISYLDTGERVQGPLGRLGCTDTRGVFNADGLGLGKALLSVERTSFASRAIEVTVTEDLSQCVRVVLEPGETLLGTVIDASGSPVRDAPISIVDANGAHVETRSAASGRFCALGLCPGRASVLAFARRRGRAREVVNIGDSGPTSISLRLSVGIELTGRVLDGAGAPMQNWQVWLSNDMGVDQAECFDATDANGWFDIIDCDNADYTLNVTSPGASWLDVLTSVAVHGGTHDLVVTMRDDLIASAFMNCAVVGRDGGSVKNASVNVSEAHASRSFAMRRETANTFRVGPLKPASYYVSATADGCVPRSIGPYDLAPREKRSLGTIALDTAGYLMVACPDYQQEFIDGRLVCYIVDATGRRFAEAVRSGAMRSGPIMPGSYSVVLAQPDGPSVRAEEQVIVRPGTVTKLSFDKDR